MGQLRNTSFWRLPYFRYMFIILSGFALTNLAIIVFAQSQHPTQASSNPFSPYADILPGQSEDALYSRLFSCADIHNYNLAPEKSCLVNLKSGIFSDIETIISNGAIRQTTFTLRDNTLKVGDLAFLFAAPNFHAYPRKVFFFWNNLFVIVSTTANGNHPSIRPVWSVTFTNRYKPV